MNVRGSQPPALVGTVNVSVVPFVLAIGPTHVLPKCIEFLLVNPVPVIVTVWPIAAVVGEIVVIVGATVVEGLTTGVTTTVTFAVTPVAALLPHATAYVVVLVGDTVTEPLVALRVENSLPMQYVAFVEVHASVADWPTVSVVEEVTREAVGVPRLGVVVDRKSVV